MTREEFTRGMIILEGGIGRELLESTWEVWFDVLKGLDSDEFIYAVRRYVAEATSAFPMPSTILNYIDELRHGEVRDHAEAFAAVMDAVRQYGSYRPAEGLASLDELTRLAVRGCGGFQWFCQMEEDQRLTASAQFRQAYQNAVHRHLRDRRLPEALRPAIAHRQFLLTHHSTAPELTDPSSLADVLARTLLER